MSCQTSCQCTTDLPPGQQVPAARLSHSSIPTPHVSTTTYTPPRTRSSMALPTFSSGSGTSLAMPATSSWSRVRRFRTTTGRGLMATTPTATSTAVRPAQLQLLRFRPPVPDMHGPLRHRRRHRFQWPQGSVAQPVLAIILQTQSPGLPSPPARAVAASAPPQRLTFMPCKINCECTSTRTARQQLLAA